MTYAPVLTLVLCAAFLSGSPHNLPVRFQSASGQSAASSAQKIAVPVSNTAEGARLYVYRQRRYEGSALAPSIYVDDRAIARVGNGRRVAIKLTAGQHSVRSDDKSSAISLEVKPGQDYFVRVDEATGFWKGHGRLTLVLPEQGFAEYKLQKPIETDRKIDKEMIDDEADDSSPKTKSE